MRQALEDVHYQTQLMPKNGTLHNLPSISSTLKDLIIVITSFLMQPHSQLPMLTLIAMYKISRLTFSTKMELKF